MAQPQPDAQRTLEERPAAALGYEFEPVPAGFATWDDYWRDVGVPRC